jgi:hypothetical protein
VSRGLSPSGTALDPLLLTGRGITVGAISVGSRAHFEAMNRAIALHRSRSVIDRGERGPPAFRRSGLFWQGCDHARLIVR